MTIHSAQTVLYKILAIFFSQRTVNYLLKWVTVESILQVYFAAVTVTDKMYSHVLVFLVHWHTSCLLHKFRQVINLLFQSLNRLLRLVLLRVSLVHHPPRLLYFLHTIKYPSHDQCLSVNLGPKNSAVWGSLTLNRRSLSLNYSPITTWSESLVMHRLWLSKNTELVVVVVERTD